jgi:hypothetical protein
MIERADCKQAILWQHENMPNLQAVISAICNAQNRLSADFWQRFYDDFFNVDTANDWGLNLWMRILNIKTLAPREVQEKTAWGFGQERKNFEQPTNFGFRSTGGFNLTLEQKRILVKMQWFKITSQLTIDSINEMLKKILWQGNARVYVVDNFDMTATYHFHYQPKPWLLFVMNELDFFPRPSGVKIDYEVHKKQAWGISRNRKNFTTDSNFGE